MKAFHSSFLIEKNAFPKKEASLSVRAVFGKGRERAVLSDHSVPGNIRRAGMKRPADLSGHTRISGKKGHMTVTDDLPRRHGAYDVIDTFKEIHATARRMVGVLLVLPGRNVGGAVGR